MRLPTTNKNNTTVYTPEDTWGDKQVAEIARYIYTEVPFHTAVSLLKKLFPTLSPLQIEIVLLNRLETITEE